MKTVTPAQAALSPTPADRRGPAPDRGDLGELLVVGLDVQPKGLVCLDELRDQRQGGLPNDLAGVINPASHGSRLRRQA
jgi:hypothetical protein